MYEELKRMVADSRNIVFFGGAGISTESGIPDFRSAGGVYDGTYGGFAPEQIISAGFFRRNTELFYKFYKEKMIFTEAKPNAAHYALAKLERDGRLSAVITQNIDGLHQLAGSRNVFELHGTVLDNRCLSCGKHFGVEYIAASDGIPCCDACGGVIKPEVTLYEESLPAGVFEGAAEAVSKADMLIVGGTSLAVYPAASLIHYFTGRYTVIINLSSTPADSAADLVIHEPAGKVLGEICGTAE